uniref:hypothetical protein n=1 Tax=Aeromonas jandaei TaxID=650 RepID=UPI001E28BCF7
SLPPAAEEGGGIALEGSIRSEDLPNKPSSPEDLDWLDTESTDSDVLLIDPEVEGSQKRSPTPQLEAGGPVLKKARTGNRRACQSSFIYRIGRKAL